MKIRNYGSIQKLDMDLFRKKDKIELIFGLSGSGKSTIVDALLGQDKISLVFDKKHEIQIKNNKISEKIENGNVALFNEKSSIEVRDNQYNCFELLGFSNEPGEHVTLTALTEKVREIINWKNAHSEVLNTYSVITKNLYKNQNQTTIGNINDEIQNIASALPTEHQDSFQEGKNVIAWLNDANTIHENKTTCLFCEGDVSDLRKERVSEIIRSRFTTSQFTKFSKVNSLQNIPFPRENLYDNETLLEEVITAKKYNDLKEWVEKIEFLDFKILVGTNKISDFKFQDDLAELSPLFLEYNSLIDVVILENEDKLNYLTKIIDNNIQEINKFLSEVHFQYKINFNINPSENSAKYTLQHIANENNSIDDAQQLSYGERNLLALIITLAGAKKDQLLILDDSMSSFDDMKRKIIVRKIREYKEARTLDVLVLTHDEYFVQQVIFEDCESEKYRVQLLYRCHDNHLKTQNIKQKNFINSIDYKNILDTETVYLKLILLRQIIEIKRKNKDDASYKEVYDKITNLIKLKNLEPINNLFEYLCSEKIDPELKIVMKRLFRNVIITSNNLEINLEEFDSLKPMHTLLVIRFLTQSGKYDYFKNEYHYFMNEIVHLFTSPIKHFDEDVMTHILNLDETKVKEYIEEVKKFHIGNNVYRLKKNNI